MEAQASIASDSAVKWSPSSEASDIVKSIHAMLHPRNIVLVGATDKPGNYAERIWNNLIKYQYQGGLYPVNAKREATAPFSVIVRTTLRWCVSTPRASIP